MACLVPLLTGGVTVSSDSVDYERTKMFYIIHSKKTTHYIPRVIFCSVEQYQYH